METYSKKELTQEEKERISKEAIQKINSGKKFKKLKVLGFLKGVIKFFKGEL